MTDPVRPPSEAGPREVLQSLCNNMRVQLEISDDVDLRIARPYGEKFIEALTAAIRALDPPIPVVPADPREKESEK